MRKKAAIISSLLFSLLFGCASPTSSSVEPSIEPASIEESTSEVANEYGELQEVKPLQEAFNPARRYAVYWDEVDYNDEGEIIGFHKSNFHDPYIFYPAHPERVEIYTSAGTKQLSPTTERSRKTDSDSELTYYSPWSKSADALCFELDHRYSITVKVILALEGPTYLDPNQIPAITVRDYTFNYDADCFQCEYGSMLTPQKEGETTISVSWNGFSCEKKVLISGDKEKTFNLSCFYNGGAFGDVYLSNGNPYKGGDVISIEIPREAGERYDYFGGPYGVGVFFNGGGLGGAYDEACLYEKAGDDHVYYRLSFEMPCSDCELVFWDYDIYS